jgi:cob(I)alamin adenosyltransferase
MQGYVQVYTGDGKGKTTAAIGLAVRAAGAGLKVLFVQFIKGGRYSEIKALKALDDRIGGRIEVRQYGRGRFIKGQPDPEDVAAARRGLDEIKALMENGSGFDIIVLDEANVAVACGLFDITALLAVIDSRPETVELVITGRGADPQVVQRADLVTEMRAVKHYYEVGVAARVGIEK